MAVRDHTEEEERILKALKVFVRILEKPNREIERELGLSPGYLSRLFGGTIDLKVMHLLQLSDALGLEVAELVRLLFPRRSSETAAAAKIREVIPVLDRDPDTEAMTGMLHEVLRRLPSINSV